FHERQGDGFALVVANLRARRSVDCTLEQRIRERLEPDYFAEPCRFEQGHPGHIPFLGRPSAGLAAGGEASLCGAAVTPGAGRSALLEFCKTLPRRQQRVLEGVFGVLERPEHAVAMRLQLAAMRLGQCSERIAVAGLRA